MFDRLFIKDVDETTLIEKAKTDERYFWYLYDRYVDKVYRFVRRRTQHESDAEDIVSEVFMAVAANIGNYDTQKEQKFTTRLLRITNNKLSDFLRKHYKNQIDEYTDIETIETSDNYDHADRLTKVDLYEKVLACAEKLPAKQSSMFILRFVEWYRNNEIAEIYNVNEKTVSSTLFVALRKIKEEVASY